MKNKISLGYQWLYDVDTTPKVALSLITDCQTSPSKENVTTNLKKALKCTQYEEYTKDVKSGAVYEVVLIKRKQIKRKK